MIEYRIGWSAFTNISFGGVAEWRIWEDSEATQDEVIDSLNDGGTLPSGLEQALEASGFQWYVDIREALEASDLQSR